MGPLDGKVAVITGAASGIVKESALIFAREGARVLLADIQDQAGQELAAQISRKNGEALYVHTDVTRSQEVKTLVDAAISKFAKLGVLFSARAIGALQAELLPQRKIASAVMASRGDGLHPLLWRISDVM